MAIEDLPHAENKKIKRSFMGNTCWFYICGFSLFSYVNIHTDLYAYILHTHTVFIILLSD